MLRFDNTATRWGHDMDQRGTDEPQGDNPNPFTDPPMRRRGPTDPQQPQQAWGQQPGYGPPSGYYPAPPPKKKTNWLGLGCLGAVVLVAAIGAGAILAGGKSSPTAASTTPPAAVAPGGTVPAAAATPAATTAPPPVATVVLQQSGNGTLGTKQFTVGDNWSLTYKFDCADFGQAGNFQVMEDYPGGNVLVNSLAKNGSNTTYQNGDAGTHSLEVNSECDWTITVTG